jgi:hypothetical protein
MADDRGAPRGERRLDDGLVRRAKVAILVRDEPIAGKRCTDHTHGEASTLARSSVSVRLRAPAYITAWPEGGVRPT